MNTRERLVHKAAYVIKRRESGREPDSIESSHIYAAADIVDAILDELMEPGERVLRDASATDPDTEQGNRLPFLDEETMKYIWQALLIAIRDGK